MPFILISQWFEPKCQFRLIFATFWVIALKILFTLSFWLHFRIVSSPKLIHQFFKWVEFAITLFVSLAYQLLLEWRLPFHVIIFAFALVIWFVERLGEWVFDYPGWVFQTQRRWNDLSGAEVKFTFASSTQRDSFQSRVDFTIAKRVFHFAQAQASINLFPQVVIWFVTLGAQVFDLKLKLLS